MCTAQWYLCMYCLYWRGIAEAGWRVTRAIGGNEVVFDHSIPSLRLGFGFVELVRSCAVSLVVASISRMPGAASSDMLGYGRCSTSETRFVVGQPWGG